MHDSLARRDDLLNHPPPIHDCNHLSLLHVIPGGTFLGATLAWKLMVSCWLASPSLHHCTHLCYGLGLISSLRASNAVARLRSSSNFFIMANSYEGVTLVASSYVRTSGMSRRLSPQPDAEDSVPSDSLQRCDGGACTQGEGTSNIRKTLLGFPAVVPCTRLIVRSSAEDRHQVSTVTILAFAFYHSVAAGSAVAGCQPRAA